MDGYPFPFIGQFNTRKFLFRLTERARGGSLSVRSKRAATVAESIKYRDVNLLDFLSEIFKIMEGKRISWNLSIYCRGGAFTALWMTLRLPPESLGPKVRDEAKECASTSMHEIERLIRAFPIAKSSRVINSKTGGKTTVEPLRLDRRGISLELLEPKAVERDRQREFERQEEVREEHERQELATYRRLVERV